jgi:hypothetical protein
MLHPAGGGRWSLPCQYCATHNMDARAKYHQTGHSSFGKADLVGLDCRFMMPTGRCSKQLIRPECRDNVALPHVGSSQDAGIASGAELLWTLSRWLKARRDRGRGTTATQPHRQEVSTPDSGPRLTNLAASDWLNEQWLVLQVDEKPVNMAYPQLLLQIRIITYLTFATYGGLKPP